MLHKVNNPDVHPFPNLVPNPAKNPASPNPMKFKFPINRNGGSNKGTLSKNSFLKCIKIS